MFEDLFKLEEVKPNIVPKDEYFKESKKILESVASAYHSAWFSKPLEEAEYPEQSVCDNCKGCGNFLYEGEKKECFVNYERGECYHRVCDYESIGILIEGLLESGNLYDIIGVDGVS
jgi:hypothetical protein